MTGPGSLLSAAEAATAIRGALEAGDFESADRLTTEAISRIMLAPASGPIPSAVLDAPGTTGNARYDTLLGTGFAFALRRRGEQPREWMLQLPPLPSEWLWDGDQAASAAFRDLIRKHTPPLFLSKNILLRERDLIAP